MKPIDDYFINQKEPFQSIMLYVRSVILNTLPNVVETYSHNIPFYLIDKKPMVYLNVLKGKSYVDVAFVHGVVLETDFPILKNDAKRKQVRSIQLKSIEELDQKEFEQLLQAASILVKQFHKPWHM